MIRQLTQGFLCAAYLCTALLAVPIGATAQSESGSVSETAEKLRNQLKTRGLVITTAQPNAPAASDGGSETGASQQPQVAATPAPSATTPATTTADATRIESVRLEDQVLLNIAFDFDSALLRADQRPKLDRLCAALIEANVQTLRILGHTDASGSAAYNARLSRLRAEEVKRYIGNQCGYPIENLEAVGVGEERLLDSSNPNADINRRVEIQALS